MTNRQRSSIPLVVAVAATWWAFGSDVPASTTRSMVPRDVPELRHDARLMQAQQPAPTTTPAPAADGRGQGQAGDGRGGRGRGGGGGGGRGGAAPIPFEDRTGFKQIFDGKTLSGWDGDPRFWRVEHEAIVGESAADKVVKPNTFIIWRGGAPADFELKLEFKISGGNTGVQYRSVEMPDVAKWVLKGYQADIDFNNQYTGMLYEERGRTFLARRGQFGYVGPNQPPAGQRGDAAGAASATPAGPRGLLGALEDGAALQTHIKQGDWNQFHVIARGNILIHVLNGRVTALFLDDDVTNRAMKGLLGLQLHEGPPMRVEFRNIWLKQL
jgi:hypothetical protein